MPPIELIGGLDPDQPARLGLLLVCRMIASALLSNLSRLWKQMLTLPRSIHLPLAGMWPLRWRWRQQGLLLLLLLHLPVAPVLRRDGVLIDLQLIQEGDWGQIYFPDGGPSCNFLRPSTEGAERN